MKKGFTLAEVLITLGIIGVVAAMTMPALIQKHRKTTVETALKKFYTTVNQAILNSVNDNGETKYWEFDTDVNAFYNKYLKNYLKTLKTEIKTESGDGEVLYLYFADGSGSRIFYKGHDWHYCIKAKDLSKKQNVTNGTKCFFFGFYPTINNKIIYLSKNYYNKGVEPHLYSTKIQVGTDDEGNPIMEYPSDKTLYQGGYWAKVIQINGWRIPDDYPLKF